MRQSRSVHDRGDAIVLEYARQAPNIKKLSLSSDDGIVAARREVAIVADDAISGGLQALDDVAPGKAKPTGHHDRAHCVLRIG
jgi:hypothetical protein